jgi:ribose transport system substrate-binding protein
VFAMRAGRGSWAGVAVIVGGLAIAGVAVGARAPKPPKVPKVTIGVVLPSVSSPVFAAVKGGIGASQATYGFHAKYIAEKPGKELAAVQQLIALHASSIVIAPFGPGTANGAINAAVAAGIPVVTVVSDAAGSHRSFFYGPSPAAEGKAQALRVLAALHTAHRGGAIEYAVSSCLPAAAPQVERRTAFEAALKANPYAKEFQLKAVGVFDTSTLPGLSLRRIEKQYASHPKLAVVYATCLSDTQNWGIVLRRHNRRNVIVAGHDWAPAVFTLIAQGWIPWSLAQSPYNMGQQVAKLLYLHATQSQVLPKGVVPSVSVFATKANLRQIRTTLDFAAALS